MHLIEVINEDQIKEMKITKGNNIFNAISQFPLNCGNAIPTALYFIFFFEAQMFFYCRVATVERCLHDPEIEHTKTKIALIALSQFK